MTQQQHTGLLIPKQISCLECEMRKVVWWVEAAKVIYKYNTTQGHPQWIPGFLKLRLSSTFYSIKPSALVQRT